MEAAAKIQDVFIDELAELRARALLYEESLASSKGTSHHTPRMPSAGGPPRLPRVPVSTAPERTHYEVLGIESCSDLRTIRRRYHELTLQCHPDKSVGKSEAERATLEERFKELSKVYQILSDSKARSEYDATLGVPASSTTSSRPQSSRYNSNFF